MRHAQSGRTPMDQIEARPDHDESEAFTTATDKPTTFGIESLNALSARLFDHADGITNITAHEMEVDIRLAAQACDKLAGLRFRVAKIAAVAPHQNGAVTARDLRDALDNAARMP